MICYGEFEPIPKGFVMVTQAYLKNRAEIPRAELMKYQGEWVAFSADGCRIVAHAATIEQLADQLDRDGGRRANGRVWIDSRPRRRLLYRGWRIIPVLTFFLSGRSVDRAYAAVPSAGAVVRYRPLFQ